ncbi:MAG: ribosome-associated protein [Solirubrobacteraceae bacterium]|nr:ribosome-associated protein [Solirubrobacteraceae bacterium]
MREIEIRSDMIRLGQLLKLADLAGSGGEARALVADGEVAVNGEVETRRGRQLHRGDVVAVGDEAVRIA